MTTLEILLPIGAWCVWWLWCVDWRRCWPLLAGGGWVVLCGLALAATLLWTVLDSAACTCLPLLTLPAFVTHLAGVLALVGIALFCGWVQGRFAWTPEEVAVDPPSSDA
jgi:hypothetical protein